MTQQLGVGSSVWPFWGIEHFAPGQWTKPQTQFDVITTVCVYDVTFLRLDLPLWLELTRTSFSWFSRVFVTAKMTRMILSGSKWWSDERFYFEVGAHSLCVSLSRNSSGFYTLVLIQSHVYTPTHDYPSVFRAARRQFFRTHPISLYTADRQRHNFRMIYFIRFLVFCVSSEFVLFWIFEFRLGYWRLLIRQLDHNLKAINRALIRVWLTLSS